MANTSYMLMNAGVLHQHIEAVNQLVRQQQANMDNLRTVVTNPAIAGSGLFSDQAGNSYNQLVKDWEGPDGLKVMLSSYCTIVANHIDTVSFTDANGANALAGETRSA